MFQRVVENISRQLAFVLIRYIAVLGFQQGEGGVAHRYRNSRFHPLYRGTWYLTFSLFNGLNNSKQFPSAISRYLVSDNVSHYGSIRPLCFVSIRYIAVLGI